jgi:hypothetical protein
LSIQLDWNVESETGSESVEEDARVIAQRRRRTVLQRRTLIIAAVLVVGLGTALFFRARTVEAQREAALRSVVEAEALALRLGDKSKFMAVQGPVEQWRAKQRRRFDEFQQFGALITVSGAISELNITGDEARVEVPLVVDGESQSAVWLYEYTANGWRHVGTESEPWTATPHETVDFTFNYFPPDAMLADALNVLLSDWWRTAAEVTHFEDRPPQLEITLDPDARIMVWAEEDEYTHLIIPTQDADGTRTNMQDEKFQITLSRLIAQYWVETASGGNFTTYDEWAVEELHLWLASHFYTFDTSPLFNELSAAFGPDVPGDFLEIVREEDVVAGFALREALIANSPGAVKGDDLTHYVESYLKAEVVFGDRVRTSYGTSSGSRFASVFMDRERTELDANVPSILPTEDGVDGSSIRMVDSLVYGDMLWARIVFVYDQYWTPDVETEPMSVFVPFRWDGHYWVHTWPREADWGPEVVIPGEFVSLRFRELDASYVGMLQPELQEQYLLLARDFGIIDPPAISAIVDASGSINYDRHDPVPTINPMVDSPFTASILPIHLDGGDFMLLSFQTTLVYELFGYQIGSLEMYRTTNPIGTALILWEVERRTTLSYDGWWEPELMTSSAPVPTKLDDLWVEGGVGIDNDLFSYVTEQQAAHTLVELLIARYGEESFADMVLALKDADNMNQWLEQSVGIMTNEIEAEWWEQYRAWLESVGYDVASLPGG